MRKRYFLLGTCLIIAALFLYHPALKYSFFQDDFYSLIKSQASSLTDVVRFFLPGQEVYYRPLSMRLFFWAMQVLLEGQPTYFHWASLIVHLVNAFLVWKLITKVSHNFVIGWLTSFLYATSSIHFITIYWISEIGLLLGIMIYLLACNQFLTHIKTSSRLSGITIILFILGLLTHELTVTLPVILTTLKMAISRQSNSPKAIKAAVTHLWPLWLIDIVYFSFRLVAFPLKLSGTYAIALGKQTLQAVFWYGVWSLNILENIKDQLEPAVKLNQDFLYGYPLLSLTSLSVLILATVFFLGVPILLYRQASDSTKRQCRNLLWFCLIWIAVTLTVPLLTPYHLYPMYAALPLVGLTTAMGSIIWWLYPPKTLMATVTISLWLFMSWQTLRLTEKIHWTVQEAKRVAETMSQLQSLYPQLPPGSTVVINQDYQIEQALYGDLGLKVLYQDPTIDTVYGPLNQFMPAACTIETDPSDCLAQHRIFYLTHK